jgi:hypothetical protein
MAKSQKTKRTVLYVRVSTGDQTTENQVRELTQIAERRAWDVVEVYQDVGVSGPRGATSGQVLTPCSRMRNGAGLTW